MIINGNIHCIFEQSGTFKNEFIKLGYHAEDYDIINNFGETDHTIDLFEQIENAFDNLNRTEQNRTEQNRTEQNIVSTIFDTMSSDDLIVAFFPCVHFCGISQSWFAMSHQDYKKWSPIKMINYITEKNRNRSYFFELLNKLVGICLARGLRLISESRSMISPDYARNWICDFVIGKEQKELSEQSLDFGD